MVTNDFLKFEQNFKLKEKHQDKQAGEKWRKRKFKEMRI